MSLVNSLALVETVCLLSAETKTFRRAFRLPRLAEAEICAVGISH
jgi:hypothetical protein